uniref:Carbohydrate sulfotransferase n=1 Tax=Oncorhynchus tshawytscha TaxID=74940 RepID=A0A8C8HEY5_ONCTS
MRARHPQVSVVLTAQHRAGRLAFAREHKDWQIRHWHLVLFTDESRFTLSTCDRRARVCRRRGERSACNILQHDRFGGGSVMVWGGISLGGRTALRVLARGSLTAIRYRDEILRPLVRPYAGAVGPGFLLMQDNARPHVAGVCQQFLQEEGIDAMGWPARSADLNPIWDIMSRSIHHVAPQTVQELADDLVQVWEEIPQETIRHLIRSMPKHCREVIQARGEYSTYEINRHLRSYLKFIFVREPFERLVSAYRNKFTRSYNTAFHKRYGTKIIRRHRPQPQPDALERGNDVSFQEFVYYLVDPRTQREEPFNEHWERIHSLCHPCLVHYDVVGKYETLEQDSRSVLRLAGADGEVHFPTSGKSTRTNGDMAAQFFQNISPFYQKKLYNLYRMDFLLFNYSNPEYLKTR